MEVIQKDRDSLRKEVETLKRKLLDYQAQGQKECGESGRSIRASPVGGGVSHASEDVPLARGPSLVGVSGTMPEDSSVRGGLVDEGDCALCRGPRSTGKEPSGLPSSLWPREGRAMGAGSGEEKKEEEEKGRDF